MRSATARLALPLVLLVSPSASRADQPAAVSEPRVRLLAPGRAPLRPLRYKTSAGQKGQMTMSLTMAMEMSLGAQTLPATNLPEMRYAMDYQITSVSAAGDIRYEFSLKNPEVIAGPGVAAPVLEAMRSAIDKMKGLRGHAVVTSRGVTREADMVMPEGADAALRQLVDGMRQTFRQISAPFPEEPVGVGAKWETVQRLNQNGVSLDQTAVSELTSLEKDQGRIAVLVSAKAEPQQVQSPNLPPGARMDLASLDAKGDGETAFDLGKMVPSSARVKTHTEMKATILVGQEKQPMGMKIDMSMAITTP